MTGKKLIEKQKKEIMPHEEVKPTIEDMVARMLGKPPEIISNTQDNIQTSMTEQQIKEMAGKN